MENSTPPSQSIWSKLPQFSCVCAFDIGLDQAPKALYLDERTAIAERDFDPVGPVKIDPEACFYDGLWPEVFRKEVRYVALRLMADIELAEFKGAQVPFDSADLHRALLGYATRRLGADGECCPSFRNIDPIVSAVWRRSI